MAASISRQQIDQLAPHQDNSIRLVFLNGQFQSELSDPAESGSEVVDLAGLFKTGSNADLLRLVRKHLGHHAKFEENSCLALNTAFFGDGAVIHVHANTTLRKPVQVVFIATQAQGSVSFPRLLIVADQASQLTCIEQYVGNDSETYFTSAVTEVVVAEKAQVDHYKLVQEGAAASHIGAMHIHQANDSIFRTHCFSFGGKLVRNEVMPIVDGERCVCTMNGLSVLSASQHVDNATVIDHAKPNSESHELYKGIYNDQSRGVFSGTIIVRPDAQKTNAYQSNQSLLLSDKASSQSRPQLKIWADDVKCSHGATVGQLNQDALFYLRSRGIGLTEARNMLVQAFVSELVGGVKLEPLRNFLNAELAAKLQSSFRVLI